MGAATAVGIMKTNVQEEWAWILPRAIEELPGQLLDVSDVPSNLEDGVVFFSVSKLKRINL